ncbi:thioesterase family protein [Prauserella halophila]|uniref:thioesterase family protein n=2 Tax=Prauserella halophila TaxID=185641 RepID=UPI0020A2E536|nr:thioesterase family protein [Prauserella halophila]MCP2235320.1 Thioesterase-like superfamily protein [Prauserella halophila]
MTTITDTEATTLEATPSYEGANIRTWIGFKHFMYLVEAAVLEHFRDNELGARELYHRHGVGLEIVDSSVQLPHVLEVDDDLEVVVEPATRQKPGHGAAFTARILIRKSDDKVLALKGKVRVALIAEKDAPASEPAPSAVSGLVLDEVAALADADETALPISDGQDAADVLAPQGSGAYLWSWRAPYFYCHYSDRVQHSAYVRAMEEVVDHFLHDRGLGVGKMLEERAWIPVVSRARVRLTADAHMEEIVHTVFTVQDFIKDMSYTATFDCYVRRGDRLVRTATGTIMHGYAISRGEKAGTVALLDEDTKKALTGDRA